MNLKGFSLTEKSEKERQSSTGYSQNEGAPAYSPFQTSFATMSLFSNDILHFLQFPLSDVSTIRTVIQQNWTKGIQNESLYANSNEFKLVGYPWVGLNSDYVASRHLMKALLAHLFSIGWVLHASVDTIKSMGDADTLVFRHQQTPPPDSEWISISFDRSDRMRVFGADSELIDAFRQLLQGLGKLQKESWKDEAGNVWEYKIHGNPWLSRGEEMMQTRLLILKFLETLESLGWSLYATIGQTPGNYSEADTWHCVREKGWFPGRTIFHR